MGWRIHFPNRSPARSEPAGQPANGAEQHAAALHRAGGMQPAGQKPPRGGGVLRRALLGFFGKAGAPAHRPQQGAGATTRGPAKLTKPRPALLHKAMPVAAAPSMPPAPARQAGTVPVATDVRDTLAHLPPQLRRFVSSWSQLIQATEAVAFGGNRADVGILDLMARMDAHSASFFASLHRQGRPLPRTPVVLHGGVAAGPEAGAGDRALFDRAVATMGRLLAKLVDLQRWTPDEGLRFAQGINTLTSILNAVAAREADIDAFSFWLPHGTPASAAVSERSYRDSRAGGPPVSVPGAHATASAAALESRVAAIEAAIMDWAGGGQLPARSDVAAEINRIAAAHVAPGLGYADLLPFVEHAVPRMPLSPPLRRSLAPALRQWQDLLRLGVGRRLDDAQLRAFVDSHNRVASVFNISARSR